MNTTQNTSRNTRLLTGKYLHEFTGKGGFWGCQGARESGQHLGALGSARWEQGSALCGAE